MSMMFEASVPPLLRTLGALSGILAKTEAHCADRKIEPLALLGFRLFPDMFAFTRQVQLSCDFAARTAARLTGADLPKFPDTETSFAELQARIEAATAFVRGIEAARFAGAETREIVIPMRGTEMRMPGLQYLTQYSLPQF